MLRDKSLIPLSRQHQHALALCVRLSRALEDDEAEIDLDAWQAEIAQQFEQEILGHFAAEEKDVFPLAAKVPALQPLVQELLAQHEVLRKMARRAEDRDLDDLGLVEFAEVLTTHIRSEERQLFEKMQQEIPPGQLAAMGIALERELPAAVCDVKIRQA